MNEIDLHVHTTASGHAFATLAECAREAADKKMKAIAITDHGPNLKGAPTAAYFAVLCSTVPQMIGSVHIYKGIESNIIDSDGTLDVPYFTKSRFDLILAYLHPFTAYREAGKKNNTHAIVNAIEKNPCIDILTHPNTPWFPVDIRNVAEAAAANGICMELNENSLAVHRTDPALIREMIEATLTSGGKFVVSSDSHTAQTLGADTKTREIISTYGIPESSILNNSLETITAFVESRRSRKQ